MKLSIEQIAIIRKKIDGSNIKIETLKDDVLDHLCCVVEILMDRGRTFDTAVGEAVTDLAPNGLDEIQRETVFLLNSKRIIFMKRTMYLIGLLTAMSMSLGIMFKWLHWPGADELTFFGFLGFAFLFLPMLAVDYFKVNINKAATERLKIILGILSALMVAMSIGLRVLHMDFFLFGPPVSLLLLLGGCTIFTFGFLPFLFFTMYKKSIS